GDGPRGERTCPFEAEVVVEAAGLVALDDEDRLVPAAAAAAERLRGLPGVALSLVLAQARAGHGRVVPRFGYRLPRVKAEYGAVRTPRPASPPSGGVDARGRVSRPRAVSGALSRRMTRGG